MISPAAQAVLKELDERLGHRSEEERVAVVDERMPGPRPKGPSPGASDPGVGFSRPMDSRGPNVGIAYEQPAHRLIAVLRASGLTYNEIAKTTGYSIPWISQVCRQERTLRMIQEEFHRLGVDQIEGMLKGEALQSLMTVVDIRDNPDTAPHTRLRAAQDILDRAIGRAVQRVQAVEAPPSKEDQLKALDEELARVEEEERRLLGTSGEAEKCQQND